MTAPESNLQARIDALEREVDVLRRFGNKDCTAMADEELQNTTPQESRRMVEQEVAALKTATPARVVPDAIWNNAIEAAALLIASKYDELEPWITPDDVRSLKKGGA